jgi:hydrogenase expression/formation protein HypE
MLTGDTKVVQRGSADKIFINTAGISVVKHDLSLSAANARAGDKIILSGTMGDHGTTIMIARGELELDADIHSDAAPLWSLARLMLETTIEIRVMRDPTRGGVATSLNELAVASDVSFQIDEQSLPVREEVKGACEILGLDPLYIGNEGKLIAVVAADSADALLARMQEHPQGRDARIIGEAMSESAGIVSMRTAFGGTRIVDLLVGEQLPRIC